MKVPLPITQIFKFMKTKEVALRSSDGTTGVTTLPHLPAELRNLVYDYYLSDYHRYMREMSPFSVHLPFIQADAQARFEFREQVHPRDVLNLEILDTKQLRIHDRWIKSIGDQVVSQIITFIITTSRCRVIIILNRIPEHDTVQVLRRGYFEEWMVTRFDFEDTIRAHLATLPNHTLTGKDLRALVHTLIRLSGGGTHETARDRLRDTTTEIARKTTDKAGMAVDYWYLYVWQPIKALQYKIFRTPDE